MEARPTVIFGINAILEKLRASPDEIAEILISSGAAASALQSQAARAGVRLAHVPKALLDGLAPGGRHQGAVARVAPFRYASFDALLEHCGSSEAPARERILFLDGITDPQNLGALLRSADGAGIGHVVIPKDRSATITPAALKASAGAAHHLAIYRITNLVRALEELKHRGYWIVGLDGRAQTSIYDRAYPDRVGIVLGSEGSGIRPLVRQHCDFLASIPMLGRVESLNVAVAGAIFLYELLRRQRGGNIDNDHTKR
jgi:23S rRNA (guanosine2251-2'-O)-methyltransferase